MGEAHGRVPPDHAPPDHAPPDQVPPGPWAVATQGEPAAAATRVGPPATGVIGSVAGPGALERLLRWRPSRRGLALAALLLVSLAVLVWTSRDTRTGYLDPTAVDPGGSRAVATLLGDLGVDVVDVRMTADVVANATGSTVLVATPALASQGMVADLLGAGPARVVLVEATPGMPAFDRLAAGVTISEVSDDEPRQPGCDLRAAARAGAATLPGLRYDARAWSPRTDTCYDGPASASVVLLGAGAERPEVVLLGSANPLTNGGLDEQGNAALALNLLGSRDSILWWRPTTADPAFDSEAVPIEELVPPWVAPVVVQVLLACLLVAWWRGRRLGRLVVEPLPVVVRAGEATAGRARLLRANRARGEAASHLRAHARERVRVRLGLPIACPPERLVHAASARTGRSPGDVGHLLYGQDPAGDEQLVALGLELDSLLVEVGGA